MLRYDKKNIYWLFVVIIMMLIGFGGIVLNCLKADPEEIDVLIFTAGLLFVCTIPILIVFVSSVCKYKRCKKVDKLGSYVYGVIVRVSRRSSIDDPTVYTFDIAVFDGEKTEILTLSFKKSLQGIDASNCYNYVMDLIKPEVGVCYGNLLPEEDDDEFYGEELTESEEKVKIDFNSIFNYDSPLFVKGKKYNNDVLFKESVLFKEVPSNSVESLREYCEKSYNSFQQNKKINYYNRFK